MRKIFIVLSPRSLPYAVHGLESLLANALEPLSLALLTDAPDDKERLLEALSAIPNPKGHPIAVFDEVDSKERAADKFRGRRHLLAFQQGHPCWRKITDPLLHSADGEEAIILDPDLYFPNRFTFEPTPSSGILLMWQKPNCLFPPETTFSAFAATKLAHHVDIGVGHIRAPLDLEWLDWFLGRIGGVDLPRSMHVEAITWSALAMQAGGGHLDPKRWLCWHRSQLKRLKLKLGVPGTSILEGEALAEAKCFHAGGAAKWWLADAKAKGLLDCDNLLDEPSTVMPFVELSESRYALERNLKGALRKIGYYRLAGES